MKSSIGHSLVACSWEILLSIIWKIFLFAYQDVENLRGPKLRKSLKDEVVVQKQKAIMEATFIADPVPDAKW